MGTPAMATGMGTAGAGEARTGAADSVVAKDGDSATAMANPDSTEKAVAVAVQMEGSEGWSLA